MEDATQYGPGQAFVEAGDAPQLARIVHQAV